MGKSEKVWCVIAAFLAFILLSCSEPVAENGSSNTGRDASTPVPMRTVTDDLGRQVTIPTNVKRAISLAPSVTESIFAVGAGDRLVGDTTYCNYPEEAKAIQKVGDTLNPNMETIVALKPDVVFVSGASQLETFTKILNQNGIAVFVIDWKGLPQVEGGLKKLSEILGTPEIGEQVSNEIALREILVLKTLDRWTDDPLHVSSVPAVPTFVQISKEPLFTIGKQSFLNGLITDAGGKSVTANVDSAFPKFSKETASALNPDVIILSDSPDNQEPNEAFKDSPAVKNGRVYKINADIISRPGPRLVDALEQIAKDLHPEKFK